ncbi:MAG: hypothetical protein HKN28_19915 [Alphaproteobacteria bacterium]|nr:hypothetical protein [Alphaproteobacteria bacterium]
MRDTQLDGTSMILGCPECNTRFAIDAQALRPDGRRVKCGKCEHVWFEEPPSPSAAEPISVTPLEPEEQSSIPTPNLPALTRADQKRTAGAAWVLVVFLLVVVGALAWFGRESIARAWPMVETIYAAVGINAFPQPGDGFSIEFGMKRVGETMLQISGEVINSSNESLITPPIYAIFEGAPEVEGAKGEILESWQIPVDAKVLGPGEKVPFFAESDPFPENTANVSVLFTNPADNQ